MIVSGFLISPKDHDLIFSGLAKDILIFEKSCLLTFLENKFVNSAQEFQKVTKVSDSLLSKIAPYFKFPDWVNENRKSNSISIYRDPVFAKSEKLVVLDINTASLEDLVKVYGIGEVIAQRILSYREILGSFVAMEQLDEVWGLSPEVLVNLNKRFKVKSLLGMKKVNINNATIKELAQFPYFKYALAKQIVIYRSMNGPIVETADLTKIKGMPNDKIKIIALYLDF